MFRYISVPVVTLSLDELIEAGRSGPLECDLIAAPRPIEHDLELAAAKSAVQQFVSTLPPSDRQLVESVFWHDVTQAEVARNLGLSRMAITKRLKKIYRTGANALAIFDPMSC
ncbi:hypothetical protein ANRL3_01482 [Anaerolineae bacterium]|nr:hypothetical protein ANRL3_01482 [Anaerolineae bacterium]